MKVWIISDIHEDIVRAREAIELLEKNNCDEIVCLWDLIWFAVPYYSYLHERNAKETIQLVKEKCSTVIVWNHDLYCINKLPLTWSFQYPEDWYELDYNAREKLAKGELRLNESNELSPMISLENKEYIKWLPEFKIVQFGDMRILLSHWIYPDFNWSTKFSPKENTDYDLVFNFMKENNCILNIAWHSHKRRILFTQWWEHEIPFNKKVSLDNSPCWLLVPCVANGTHPNGVAILSTDTREIEFLPLWTPLHVVPDVYKL